VKPSTRPQRHLATRHGGIIGALLAGLAVAIFTTSGKVQLPPAPLLLLAGAAVMSTALFIPARARPLATLLGALASGAVAGQILLAPGVPRVHDLMHFWGIWAYGRCVAEGAPYPLWVPYLGAGIPLLQFYGPLNFLLALPGILLGLSPVGAWKLEMFSGHLLSALSMLAGARLLGVRWRAALLAAVALACAPWRLAVFDYRGALGEANAFLFMPLIAAAALRMLRAPSLIAGAVLALSVAALILTHTISLFTLLLVLLPALVLSELFRKGPGRTRRLYHFSIPWLIAAGLTAAWWIPVLIETGQTSIEATTADNRYYSYREQGVSPSALLERRLWDRPRVALPETLRRKEDLEGEQMPFYTGSVLVLLGLSAGLWSRSRAAWATGLGALIGLALSTSLLAGIVDTLPFFAPLRFPWRFLSPAAVLAALALGLGLDKWAGRHSARLVEPVEAARRANSGALLDSVLLTLILCALVWDGAPYMGAPDRIPPYTGVVHWYTDDPAWIYWERSMQSVPVEIVPESAPLRLRNLELPPSEYAVRIDSFFPGYYEWLTPTIYRTYWRSRDPSILAEAGVSRAFSNSRRYPAIWTGRPYVTLERDGIRELRAPVLISRKPGRIEVAAEISGEPATLLALEQAFPGWRVRVDGGAWSAPRELRGFLAVDLVAGRHRVEFDYGTGTPARRWGLLVTTLTLIGCAGFLFLRSRAVRQRAGANTG